MHIIMAAEQAAGAHPHPLFQISPPPTLHYMNNARMGAMARTAIRRGLLDSSTLPRAKLLMEEGERVVFGVRVSVIMRVEMTVSVWMVRVVMVRVLVVVTSRGLVTVRVVVRLEVRMVREVIVLVERTVRVLETLNRLVIDRVVVTIFVQMRALVMVRWLRLVRVEETLILLVTGRVLVMVTWLDTMTLEVMVRVEGMMEVEVTGTVVVITRRVVNASVHVLVVMRVVESVRVTVTVQRAFTAGKAASNSPSQKHIARGLILVADLVPGGRQFICSITLPAALRI